MRSITTGFVIAIVCIFLAPACIAQQLSRDGAGWYLRGDVLYSTPNWGREWHEITPSIPGGYHLSSVFF